MKLRSKIFIAGVAIILASNAVALLGVAYNRSGEPDAVVELSERELGMPHRYRGLITESTGLALSIKCRVDTLPQSYGYYANNCMSTPDWLDRNKLIELGFDPESLPEARADTPLSGDKHRKREAYLVLEYNGNAYRRTVAKAEKKLAQEKSLLDQNPNNEEYEERVDSAQESLLSEQRSSSRLFAIDAGRDREALRNKYPDSSRYIIMLALIKPIWLCEDPHDHWTGRISGLLIETINIPLAYRHVFEPLEVDTQYDANRQPPRYRVRVAFGKRAEPWVLGVERIQPDASNDKKKEKKEKKE
jgi:hypothetical protein